jgi:hypothetical protein
VRILTGLNFLRVHWCTLDSRSAVLLGCIIRELVCL